MKYSVVLKGFPANEIAFIRAVRTLGAPRLQDVQRILQYMRMHNRITLYDGIDHELAMSARDRLRASGVEVIVTESTQHTPLRCDPAILREYEWRFPRLLVRKA